MPEATDDSIQLQPLALGYIVSTAPIEHAPDFFWSYCPSARYTNPVHLRSALHINTSAVQQNDDQFLTNAGKNASNMNNHALDSSLTTDVLRYALETYNALSWLSLSPSTGDRRSCLPIHMQALCRLHRTLNRLL
uniref:Mediator of RNA polymerase II transcription subunit 13 n=1 Tax=Romanomermis culicivorax TaxID=13658 RepID=A0A915KRF1_ROMCU